MALPSSGPLSFSDIQSEFGGSNPISLSEYYRGGSYVTTNNTGVPTSGQIALNVFRGTVKQFAFTISTNYSTPQNLRSLALAAGWNGTDAVLATNNANISSNTTGTPALTINGSFPNGLVFVNNGYIVGMGGAGGNYGQAGNAGGTALTVSSAVSITNNGTIAGGGGGGGSSPVFGWGGVDLTTPGGGGGSGLTQSLGGTGGNWTGNPSTLSGSFYSVPGAGFAQGNGGVLNSPSGSGGAWGAAGVTGGYAGGAGGAAVNGNSFITWLATGTRTGAVS
jgi:Phage tail fibre adhesin Gp38